MEYLNIKGRLHGIPRTNSSTKKENGIERLPAPFFYAPARKVRNVQPGCSTPAQSFSTASLSDSVIFGLTWLTGRVWHRRENESLRKSIFSSAKIPYRIGLSPKWVLGPLGVGADCRSTIPAVSFQLTQPMFKFFTAPMLSPRRYLLWRTNFPRFPMHLTLLSLTSMPKRWKFIMTSIMRRMSQI